MKQTTPRRPSLGTPRRPSLGRPSSVLQSPNAVRRRRGSGVSPSSCPSPPPSPSPSPPPEEEAKAETPPESVMEFAHNARVEPMPVMESPETYLGRDGVDVSPVTVQEQAATVVSQVFAEVAGRLQHK